MPMIPLLAVAALTAPVPAAELLEIRVQDAKGFRPLPALKNLTQGLDPRWEPGTAAKVLQAMAALARDTPAEAFYNAQSGFYQRLNQACRTGLLCHLDQTWYQKTFGNHSRDTFTLCIAPLNGGSNYGAQVANNRGGQDLFAMIGTMPAKPGTDPAFTER